MEHYQFSQVESTVNRLVQTFQVNRTKDFILRCKCSALPALKRKNQAWQVVCPNCKARGPTCRTEWSAVLKWNKGPKSRKISWQKLPVFSLRRIEKAGDARLYVTKCKVALERLLQDKSNRLARLKKNKSRLKSIFLSSHTCYVDNDGKIYSIELLKEELEKIRCLLLWSEYALSLFKKKRRGKKQGVNIQRNSALNAQHCSSTV